MEIVNRNLRFLREQASLTQKELAGRLQVKPPVIGSYEEGRSIPPVPMSIKIAKLFDVSLDDLLLEDLKSFGSDTGKSTNLRGRDVLAITINSRGDENVELVTQKASAGYTMGYSDPDYIKELPKISLPFLAKTSTYRAFEIKGDSMLPVKSHDIIIGKYLDNFNELKAGGTYIIVSKSNGVVYKRLLESMNDTLILISDNAVYDPFTIQFNDVLEIWAFVVRLTQEEEKPELPLTYLEKIMNIKRNTDGAAI